MREDPVRVVVQHRFTLTRDAIAAALRLLDGIEVVDAVASLPDAALVSQREHPDVVVIDLGQDRSAAFAAEAGLSEMFGPPRIVGIVDQIDAAGIADGERAGINHLVSTTVGLDALVEAIRDRQGLTVRHFVHVNSSADGRQVQALTQREYAVLERVAAGESRAMIAQALQISAKTVDSHKRNLVVKLGATNQAHAVSIALKRGLLPQATS